MTWQEEFEDADFGIQYLGKSSKEMLLNFISSKLTSLADQMEGAKDREAMAKVRKEWGV